MCGLVVAWRGFVSADAVHLINCTLKYRASAVLYCNDQTKSLRKRLSRQSVSRVEIKKNFANQTTLNGKTSTIIINFSLLSEGVIVFEKDVL